MAQLYQVADQWGSTRGGLKVELPEWK